MTRGVRTANAGLQCSIPRSLPAIPHSGLPLLCPGGRLKTNKEGDRLQKHVSRVWDVHWHNVLERAEQRTINVHDFHVAQFSIPTCVKTNLASCRSFKLCRGNWNTADKLNDISCSKERQANLEFRARTHLPSIFEAHWVLQHNGDEAINNILDVPNDPELITPFVWYHLHWRTASSAHFLNHGIEYNRQQFHLQFH